MRGRRIAIPLSQRMVLDILYFAKDIPTVPVQRRMSLMPLVAAREKRSDKVGWIAIFTKAYGMVSQEFPELRRAYVKLPWPGLYEYAESKASILIERDYNGEPALLPESIVHPEQDSLRYLDGIIEHARRAPLEELKTFRRWILFARLPTLLRRIGWWIGLNWGRQRGSFFGTFGVSVYSSLGAESLHPLGPSTTVLNYGVISKNGEVDVRIIYDHRVMNGATVARALTRLEAILNSSIVQELDEERL